jgi:hypothetical protein
MNTNTNENDSHSAAPYQCIAILIYKDIGGGGVVVSLYMCWHPNKYEKAKLKLPNKYEKAKLNLLN